MAIHSTDWFRLGLEIVRLVLAFFSGFAGGTVVN